VATKERRRWTRWLGRFAVGLVVLVAVAVGLFVFLTRNPDPDDFYDPPDDVDAAPGTILRSEEFDQGIPEGARAWRVLYASTDEAGEPIAVSGLVIAPEDAGPGPHPVLAWAHGTTGVARPCAPSLSDAPLEGIPDMTGALAEGWVLTLTDYPGLGTPSPHPYLVGESQGRAVLDSVRAAHELDTGVELADEYVVWGHSQGGHAALFAGQLAPAYLPEQELLAVAALAPATRLEENFAAIEGTQAGNVLTILAVDSWSAYYPEISDDILVESARRPAARIADSCLNQPSRFRIVVAGLTLPSTITSRPVSDDPTWTARLDENAPDPAAITAPLFVAQGDIDQIVDATVTEGWVADRCASGAPTHWQTYPGIDHLEVVEPGGDDALAWTIALLAGDPQPEVCPPAG
jgi:alpha-beta hydrolase superfamily lysophospholipase